MVTKPMVLAGALATGALLAACNPTRLPNPQPAQTVECWELVDDLRVYYPCVSPTRTPVEYPTVTP